MIGESVLLSQVCEIIMGQAPPGDSYNQLGDGMPLVAGAGDLGLKFPTPAKFTTKPKKICQKGDIILCIRATIGEKNWADKEYCIGRGVAVLRPKPEYLSSSYLWHWIEYSKGFLLNNARGSTFKQVSKDVIERWRIQLPGLNEQNEIAAILEKAAGISKSITSSIEVKPSVIRSIFIDLFGDMLTNSMNWPTYPLGDICQTQLGKAISKEAKLCLSPSKYLRNANVQWREIHFSDLKEMDFKENEKSKLRILDGDILATEGGDVGRCAIWNYGQQEIFFQNSLHRIRVDDTLLTPEYLVEYFAIMSERGGLIRETTQVTIAHLTGTKLRKLIVPLPPLEIQKRFSRILERINSFHTSAKQRTNEITLSLQQEMFA